MSYPGPSQIPRQVEPVPYAGVATPNDAMATGSASRAILVGGILLRLIGAYTLVECRAPLRDILDFVVDSFGRLDLWPFGWIGLVRSAYIAWGLLLVIRGPRWVIRSLRRVPASLIGDGAEWSAAALAAAGAVIILWTMEPLAQLFSTRALFGGIVTTLGQLALGTWLFLAAGRMSAIRQ